MTWYDLGFLKFSHLKKNYDARLGYFGRESNLGDYKSCILLCSNMRQGKIRPSLSSLQVVGCKLSDDTLQKNCDTHITNGQ
jgi:hypothetical protein